MPELPEVENTARNLHRWAAGARVGFIEVLDPKLGTVTAFDPLIGQRLERVWRRAKWVVMQFESDGVLLHLRMTGKLVRIDDSRRERLRMGFDNGATIRFIDPRRFGTVEPVSLEALATFVAGGAPEPWPDVRDAAWWGERLGDARSPIKQALIDGERVAGLGNIAASEILWRAQVAPGRRANTLDERALEAIAAAAWAFLDERVAADAGDEIDYVNEGGHNPFDVYQRHGAPCRRCGHTVVRVVQGGRSTFFCPGCQA